MTDITDLKKDDLFYTKSSSWAWKVVEEAECTAVLQKPNTIDDYCDGWGEQWVIYATSTDPNISQMRKFIVVKGLEDYYEKMYTKPPLANILTRK